MLHSPTPRYRRPSHSRIGTPRPYAYTKPTAVLSSPKSYSRGSVGDAAFGSERYAAIEDAREEKTKSEKMSVVRVQNGPYRSAGLRWLEM
jgi:hypothetical protein